MNFNDFKRVEKTYKHLSKGTYNRVEVEKVYKMLPQEFKVQKSTKNERVAAIKTYFEKIFLEGVEKILGTDGLRQLSGKTTT